MGTFREAATRLQQQPGGGGLPRKISAWARPKEMVQEGWRGQPCQSQLSGFDSLEVLGDLDKTCFPGIVGMKA